jgi:hypothetical protein
MKKTLRSWIPHPALLFLAMAVSLALAGCNKKAPANQVPATQTPSKATPLEQALDRWRSGDQAGAVDLVIQTDWQIGPVFSPGSPMSHRERDLPGMPQAEQEAVVKDATTRLQEVKALAFALRDKGKAAAATDKELARRCFAQIDKLGAALNQPDGMLIVQMTGKALGKIAAAESAKLEN